MATTINEVETFYPTSRQEWRQWLQEHHAKKQSVWIIQYKKASGMPTLSWSDAVDEALCFGWIDSTRRSIGHDKFMQFFTHRKARSVWSRVNKEKVQRLTDQGLMAPAGMASVNIAKQNGSWAILDEVEELVIPAGLQKAFKARPGSQAFFLSLSKSVRKSMLQWLVMAKRPETMEKRIAEIADMAAQGLKPKQF